MKSLNLMLLGMFILIGIYAIDIFFVGLLETGDLKATFRLTIAPTIILTVVNLYCYRYARKKLREKGRNENE